MKIYFDATRRAELVSQSEAAECGLACLAMVSSYHGLQTDLPAMRQRFSLSLKGATLKSIMHMAEQIGFNARPLRGEIEDLCQVQLPAILHWDLNHFVVLARVGGLGSKRYTILDPARGERKIGREELSRHWTGVLLELTPGSTFQRRNERSQMRLSQLWSRMGGAGTSLGGILALSLILQLIALASPFYLQLAVDTALPSFDKDLIIMLAVGFGGLALISAATGALRSLLLVSLAQSLSFQVVVNLNRHLLRLPLPWFEKRHVGDVVSRFGSTQPIADLLAQGLVAAVIDGLMAGLTLLMLFLYSPKLALVALIAWSLFAAIKIASLSIMRMKNIDVITTMAKENSNFIESVRGIAGIKAFGEEGNRQRRWQHLKADAVNANIRMGRLSSGFDSAGQLVLGLERVIFVYLAITMAMEGDFTVGMIFAFQAYKENFLDAATRLVDFGIRYRLLDVHLNRIADIALAAPESGNNLRSESIEPILGEIELRNIWFRYGTGEAEVLKGVNFKVEAGQPVVLVGPSGGGKTTLLKIMMGLLEPVAGQVLIDGKPLASIGLQHWRRQTASVAQDDLLYAGSLAENIAFFDPEIEMARVVDAAKRAAIHDMIEAMPMRYDSLVGDMGSSLSGGQRQRVLLARAFYRDFRVLFVDEGTAHLDPAAEGLVSAQLAMLTRTRVIVSHRSLNIPSARIYLVQGGQVFEAQPPTPETAHAA